MAENTNSKESTNFHPEKITLTTFRKLLTCYKGTVEQVHRRKMVVKLQPKAEKGSKRKVDKSGSRGATATIQKTRFDSSEEDKIRDEVGQFVELDCWRYEKMPAVIQGRKLGDGCQDGQGKGDGESVDGGYFMKDDLVRIMEWKIKHGVYRPMLMGMIKGNQLKAVLTSTSTAIKALPTVTSTAALDEFFPNESINALNTLRGVGPATSSLILSIATGKGPQSQQVPFYSDDVYIWLCRHEYPETVATRETIEEISMRVEQFDKNSKGRPKGKLDMKYNIAEYRDLWRACWELRLRLDSASTSSSNSEGDKEEGNASEMGLISMADIEKVAFVLRNISVSGFYDNIDPQEILEMSVEQQESLAADLEKARAMVGGEKVLKEDTDEEDPRESKRKKN